MFCEKCGNELKGNNKFCTSCGAPVGNGGSANMKMQGNQNSNFAGLKNICANDKMPMLAAAGLVVYIIFLDVLLPIVTGIRIFGINFFLRFGNWVDLIANMLKNDWYYFLLIVLCFMKNKSELLIVGVGLPIIQKFQVLTNVFSLRYTHNFNKLGQILQVASWVTLLILVIVCVVNELRAYRRDIVKLYFVPACLTALVIVIDLLLNRGLVNMFDRLIRLDFLAFIMSILYLVGWLGEVFAIFAIGKWVSNQ